MDPVRFLSNPSTGKMGFAIAAEAARRGHEVTLIAGPVALKTPRGVQRVDVVSAREMLQAVILATRGAQKGRREETVFISTAAVADWRPAKCSRVKLKKGEMTGVLRLVRNPDILKSLCALSVQHSSDRLAASSPVNSYLRLKNIGFAAETDHVLKEAARKCREKGLSFIVANDVSEKGSGFGTDTNRVTFVFPDGTQRKFPLMTKRMVAKRILEEIENEE